VCGRRAQTQTQVPQVLLGGLKYALPGWEGGAESRRAADTATEASWRSHASGSGDGGGLGGDSSWGAGYGGDVGPTGSHGSRAAGREAQTPRLVGACERQARGFLVGALRCLACCESPSQKTNIGASRDPGGPSLSRLPPSQLLALSTSATTTHSGAVRQQPPKRRNGGRRAKRQHRARALAAARTATTSKAAPAIATRGAPSHGRSDAIEAAALAAALAESALESESEEHKAGLWGQFTPSHLYGFDGLCDPHCVTHCGSYDDFGNPHGDWLDFG
jgi:hypothetical protein